MPFAKTNWESDPPVPNGGYFDFGHPFSVKNLTLRKADHRPCFIHVSSEVECVVTALSVVASVEVLDLYALVGPMDCFDYRHIAKLKGTPMDPSIAMFGFRIDASVIPRERVWQIQLKLSAPGSQQNTVILHELAATLERANNDGSGGMDMSLGPRRASPRVLGNPTVLGSTTGDRLSTSRGGGLLGNTAGEAHIDASLSGSHRSQRVGPSSMRLSRGHDLGSTGALLSATLGGSGKPSTPLQGGGLSASRSTPSMSSSGTPAVGMATSMSSSSFSRLARDDSPPPPPRRSSKSTRYSSSTSGVGTRSSSHHGSHHSHHLTKSRSREMAHGGMGGGQMQMREETAAVASVLNAVCEKMVGVVSDKTKNYLFRAGRRTERKVLDKVQRLEERIERFDQVLERSSIKKIGEIEDAVLSLDSQFKSPAFGLNSPPTATATPTSVRAST